MSTNIETRLHKSYLVYKQIKSEHEKTLRVNQSQNMTLTRKLLLGDKYNHVDVDEFHDRINEYDASVLQRELKYGEYFIY